MKKFFGGLAVLVAMALLLVSVGIVAPEAPVAGPVAEAVQGLLEASGAAEEVASALRQHTYYQYLDERGQVRFAEKLSDVPEPWRSRAGRVRLEGPPPGTPGEARAARAEQVARRDAAEAPASYGRAAPAGSSLPKITVYGAPSWSEDTREILAYLDKKGLPYEFKDVDEDSGAFLEMKERANTDYVPVIMVGDGIVKGWSKRRFETLLKKKG